MNDIQYKYEILERKPISDEIWESLDENKGLTEGGFSQEEFTELVVDVEEVGIIEVYTHNSILDRDDALKYVIQHGIVSKIDNQKHEKESQK